MAAITWTDVTNLAPTLSTLTAGQQSAVLAQVAVRVTETVWGTLYTSAASALAAHLGTLVQRSASASGAITSEGVGPLSRGYGALPNPDNSSLGLTSWGVLYRELCATRPESMGLVA